MIVTTLGEQGEWAAVNSHTGAPLIYSDLARPAENQTEFPHSGPFDLFRLKEALDN